MVFDRQKKTLITIIILLAIITVITQYIIVNNTPKIIEEKTYFVKGEIGDKVGVLIDAETIDFGRIPQDGASQKEITVGNSYDKDVKVIVNVYGEIADMIEVRPNNFVLKPNDSKIVYAQFNSGFNEIGIYEGYLKVSLVS